MNLSQLIKQMDDIESGAPSFKKYINESVYSAPEMQRHWKRLDEGFFKGYDQYLAEVALTPEQIQNIFKQAGGGAAGGAQNPGKLAALVDKVLPTSQAAGLEKSLPAPDAGPVQGFEQKASAAVQNLPGVDSGTKQSLMQMVKAGIKKPETQQLILAAVGAGLGSLISKVGPILSMIPGGGAVASAVTGAIVAGGVAVLAAKLRGEDWKSAFKGAIKPALMGGAAAVIGNLATTAVSAMTSGSSDQPASLDNPKASSGQGASSDPDAPVGGGMKNGDGSPMTNADMKKAMDTVAPVAGGDADPNKYYNSLSPDQQRATDDAVVAQAQANTSGITPRLPPGASMSDFSNTSGGSDYPSAGKVRANLDQWRTDTGSPNAPQAISPSTPSDGSYQQSAPIGADGKPMQQVPMDEPYPSAGKVRANLDQWRADNASGATAGGVPIGSTPDGINRLTGQPISQAPAWDQMTPDQQAAVTARQQQQAADAAQGTQNAKDYWANKPAYTRGLKESFAESAYVDKQATLRMWLDQEAQGLAVSGLALKTTVKEGIMDSLKGMFGGKKDAAAAPAGGVTADALNKAWTTAGSPTDSEEVAKVLQGAGVPAETVTKIFTDLKLPAPGASPAEKPATPADAADPNAAPATPSSAAPTPAAPGAEPPATPQAEKQSKVGVGQINKIIPTLRVRDLTSVQKNVDATLAKRGKTAPAPQPTAEGKYVGFYSKFLGKEI